MFKKMLSFLVVGILLCSTSFLVAHDNWNHGDRYLSDTETYAACATYIYTPTTK